MSISTLGRWSLNAGKKSEFPDFHNAVAWRTLHPVTSQGLLAACPADASLYPWHLTTDQRPTQAPIAAVGRGSIYLWLTPETMVTLKGPETPLLPVSVFPCINPHNSTWQYRKWQSRVKKNTDEYCKSCFRVEIVTLLALPVFPASQPKWLAVNFAVPKPKAIKFL